MTDMIYSFNGYDMRKIKEEDIDRYYVDGFLDADEAANYFTGTLGTFTQDQVTAYVKKIVSDKSRYDFIILKDEKIIGEVVINNIEDGKAHYRICLFKKENFSKGIGFEATRRVIKFVFDNLKLNSIDLEVFPFNKRGIALYEKMGFEFIETIKDDEANEPYIDINIMRLSKENFKCLL